MAYQILNIGKEVQEDNLELTEEQLQGYRESAEFNYFMYDSYEGDSDIFSVLLEEKGESGCADIRIIKLIEE
jgi:hypothetical protein